MTYDSNVNAIVRWSAGLLAGLALAIAGPAGALAQQADAAGSFVAVTGDVKILGVDGVTRVASPGGGFRQGDSIVTGADGVAQLRMTDGSALSVRASSRVKLDRYRYEGKEDRDPSFLVSIAQGGFRTITGLISRIRRDNYRVATPSAAMGVRGTDFEIVHVEQTLPDAAAGTYNRVYEGVTALRNRKGVELLVSRGQTAFVALPGDLAPVLVAPPGSIFGIPTAMPPVEPRSGETETGAETGTASAPVLINPIDTPSTPVLAAPATVTISPVLTLSVTATISPTLAEPTTVSASPTLSAPVMTTVGPISATLSPTLTAPVSATVSPTLTSPTTVSASPTLSAPVTSTVGPISTTLSPTLTAPVSATVSPTLTAPTSLSVSPTLTAPLTATLAPVTTSLSPTVSAPITATISPTSTSPLTVTAAPVLSAPVATTIAPTLTAPITSTISGTLSSTTGSLLGR